MHELTFVIGLMKATIYGVLEIAILQQVQDRDGKNAVARNDTQYDDT